VFAILSGLSALIATAIFLGIYGRTAKYARDTRSVTQSMKPITEEQIRDAHRGSFDVEEYIRQWKYLLAQADFMAEPFQHETRAEVGFYLYVASAVFGAAATVIAAAH